MKIEIVTSLGTIRARLFPDRAPKTVENFLAYAEAGFYTNTIFHRVINRFMIQGGGYTAAMKEKVTNDPIECEANNGLKNDKYAIAMARTSAPHSATSQFFINTVNNGFLDFKSESPSGWGYAVFGHVIEGQDVVDQIERVKTHNYGSHSDVPVTSVMILSVKQIPGDEEVEA